MNITLEIERFNPETDSESRLQQFRIEVDPTDRVLDALLGIRATVDPTLSFRSSCAHGVCGSDAMRINGKEALACKTLFCDIGAKDGDTVKIEPLRHMKVQRDLMVDNSAFMEKYRSVQPYLIPGSEVSDRERLQSPEEHEAYEEATKCIMCGACYSACTVLDENPDFLGPAALVQAARFVRDSRDAGVGPRLSVLDTKNGLWGCGNHYACTKVCPRGIKITKLINLTKKQIRPSGR